MRFSPNRTGRSLADQIAAARVRWVTRHAFTPCARHPRNGHHAYSSRVPYLGASRALSIRIPSAIKGDMTVYGTSRRTAAAHRLDKLHSSLLLGDLGRNYSELAASRLWVPPGGGWRRGRSAS